MSYNFAKIFSHTFLQGRFNVINFEKKNGSDILDG